MTYSAAAKTAAVNSFVTLLGSGAKIRIKSAGGTVLAEIALANPIGTVNATTGQLTLSISAQEDSALATGDAATAEIATSANVAHLTMPCVQGTIAESGSCVLSSLTVVAGETVTIQSAVIG